MVVEQCDKQMDKVMDWGDRPVQSLGQMVGERRFDTGQISCGSR